MVSAEDEIVGRTRFGKNVFEVAEDKLVIDAPGARRLDHPRGKIDTVEPATDRQILEDIADEPGPRTQIQNAPRRRRTRQDAVRERAHMDVAAVAQQFEHGLVVMDGKLVEQGTHGERRMARQPA